MALTMVEVRAVLDLEEPDYEQAAKLGPEALPHLEKLVKEADTLLASKAVYLAALIQDERSVRIVREAALREDPILRVAAAAAARYLPCTPVSEILISLVNDTDVGVQRVALESARADATAELRASIERLTTYASDPNIQRSAKQVLRRISFGYQPDKGSMEEDVNGMGSSAGSKEGRSGMGLPGSVGGMGSPRISGRMEPSGMGREPDGVGRVASGSMGQRSMSGTDESAVPWERAAVAWERAAAAWEKKRRCGCGSSSHGAS